MVDRTITNKQLLTGYAALVTAARANWPKQRVAWKLSRNLRALKDPFEALRDAQRALAERYAEHTADGRTRMDPRGADMPKVDPAQQAAFDADWRELLAQELTVQLDPLPVGYLGGDDDPLPMVHFPDGRAPVPVTAETLAELELLGVVAVRDDDPAPVRPVSGG